MLVNTGLSAVPQAEAGAFPVLYIAALVLGIAATVSFLTKRKSVVTVDVVLRKTLASILFIMTGAFASVYSKNLQPVSQACLITGLCFGMLGDIWLDLKYVFPQEMKRFLNSGFLSFLFGHVFFCAAMIVDNGFDKFTVPVLAGGAVAVGCFTAFTENILKVKYGEFKKITVTYMSVLGATLALSSYYMFTSGFEKYAVIMSVGLVFFIASDALLAGIYFGNEEKARTSRVSIVLNHALYYTAQFLIATSVIFK